MKQSQLRTEATFGQTARGRPPRSTIQLANALTSAWDLARLIIGILGHFGDASLAMPLARATTAIEARCILLGNGQQNAPCQQW